MFSNTGLNSVFTISVSFVLEKSSGAGNLGRAGPERFPWAAVARPAALWSCSGEGEGNTLVMCQLRRAHRHQSLDSRRSCFSVAFCCEQKNRAALTVRSLHSQGGLHLLSSKHLVQGQHTIGNLFSSVMDQRLDCIVPDSPLPTPVPARYSIPVKRSLSSSLITSNDGRFTVSQKQTLGSRWDGSGFQYLWQVDKWLNVSKLHFLHYVNKGDSNITSLLNIVVMRIRRNNKVMTPVPHTQ